MNIFSYPFMQRALLAALLSGLVAPAIGMYIVQRRLSLLGDGLGHVAIMGVGLALLTGTAPLPMAVVTCVAGSVAVELLRQSGKTSGDLGLAVLFYGGIASGVMMAGIAGQGPAGLSAYLFGALTSVSESDLRVIAKPAAAVPVLSLGLPPRLFAVRTNKDFAPVPGIRVKLLNLPVVVISSVTVTLLMRPVGLLLISALMVIPVTASQQLSTGFHATLPGAMASVSSRRSGHVRFPATGTPPRFHHRHGGHCTAGDRDPHENLSCSEPRFIPFASAHGKKKRILAEKATVTGPPFG